MALIYVTSPHAHGQRSTGFMMLEVALACLPGLLALTLLFGWGSLLNVVLSIVTAVSSEALMLKLRDKPIAFYLRDNSALVTGLLLGLALPPLAPWWLIVLGSAFAIIVVKQLYGGLGSNPFNPAMAGYVLLLISFPVAMTTWLPPAQLSGQAPGLLDSVQLLFTGSASLGGVDAYSGATPLDTFRTYAGQFEALAQQPVLHGLLGGMGWEWVNVGFLIGGLYLLVRRIITWHIPVSMLAMMIVFGGLANYYDADTFNSPLMHLLSGGTLLGAFFIATDPVSAPTSTRGKLIYGACIGFWIILIRNWGGYPDAIAFAVLLMNLAAPMIDYFTQPRTYGHSKANQPLLKKK